MTTTTQKKFLLPVTVRAMVPTDQHAVLQIADDSWAWPRIRKILDRLGSGMLVACYGKRVVGFVTFQQTPGRLEVLHLHVCPRFRRRGVGAHLLAMASAEGARLGIPAGCTVREHDDPMIGLLARSGFRGKLHKKFFKDGEDAIHFKLTIN